MLQSVSSVFVVCNRHKTLIGSPDSIYANRPCIPTNSLVTQLGDKETEKQEIVSNYYIRDKEDGWKQVKVSEISPNNSRNYTQN